MGRQAHCYCCPSMTPWSKQAQTACLLTDEKHKPCWPGNPWYCDWILCQVQSAALFGFWAWEQGGNSRGDVSEMTWTDSPAACCCKGQSELNPALFFLSVLVPSLLQLTKLGGNHSPLVSGLWMVVNCICSLKDLTSAWADLSKGRGKGRREEGQNCVQWWQLLLNSVTPQALLTSSICTSNHLLKMGWRISRKIQKFCFPFFPPFLLLVNVDFEEKTLQVDMCFCTGMWWNHLRMLMLCFGGVSSARVGWAAWWMGAVETNTPACFYVHNKVTTAITTTSDSEA